MNWDVEVTDPEDGTIDYQDLIVQPALGHDSHNHPTVEYRGKTGSVVTDLGGGHSEDMKVYFILGARYTDGGDGDVPPLTGTAEVVLQPKHKQAEHADRTSGTLPTAAATGDAEGGDVAYTGLGNGQWAAYDPVNFTGVDQVSFRVASTQEGGGIELRRGSPTGEVVGTAAVPSTGSTQRWQDVTIDAPDSDRHDGAVRRVHRQRELPPELHRLRRPGHLAGDAARRCGSPPRPRCRRSSPARTC